MVVNPASIPHRPITCLNTCYKALTGTLTQLLNDHVVKEGLLPAEQKAQRKGQRGCADALTVDGAVAAEAVEEGRELAVGWVDYRKPYDLVSHRWIKRVLKAVRAPKEIARTIRRLIPLWCTELVTHAERANQHPGDL